MLDNNLQRRLFHLTSLLTRWFPRSGAWLLDTLVLPIVGNKLLVRHVLRQNARIIKRVDRFEKILVIADIHIGDAVMMQAAVTAFRDFFPEARIDYVIKKGVECLVEGHPDISNLYPFFTGSRLPAPSDVEGVRTLVANNQYDLCLNCSPFFADARVFPKSQKSLTFMTVAPQLARNELDRTGINHFLFQSREFIQKVLSPMEPQRTRPFKGVPVTLSDKAVDTARRFLAVNRIPPDRPVLFLNPDTASPYTCIPFEQQVGLLKHLLRLPAHILLGSGFVSKGIERRLVQGLSADDRRRITNVPSSFALDEYTSLVDFADVFISGDTGPLHMAAARKVSKSRNVLFRNRTFVISVFGATPAHMSGYDSTDPLFPAANQDVQSRTYVSESPCRNITCVNKMAKTCRSVRCFEALDLAAIAADIKLYLRGTNLWDRMTPSDRRSAL